MASDLESEVDNLQLIYGYPIDGPYDFELWYDSAKKKYSFSIETLIEFNDANAGSKNFVRNILKEFALWMLENNHDLTYRLSYWDVFNHGITIDGEYDTIEQAYAAFRVLALGFSHGTGTKAEPKDELQNKVEFGWDEEAKVWVAIGEDPKFALENDSIVTLAGRVEKIIPEMKEINIENIEARDDSLERWLVISDPVEGYGLFSRNEWKSEELLPVLEKYASNKEKGGY